MQPTATPLVDVHAHFVTEEYIAEATRAGHARPDGMPGWPSWSVAGALSLMERAGIERQVLSVSSPGVHFGDDEAATRLAMTMNRAAAAIRDDHPDRFGFFGVLPLPAVEASIHQATWCLDELGADGVAVETNAHGVYLGDERLAPLWSLLDARGATVFVHPTTPACGEAVFLGRPRPMFEFLVDTARTVIDLAFSGTLHRYGRIQWVFTHGGGVLPLLADRLELFRSGFGDGSQGPDITTLLTGLWWDMAGTPFPRQVPALADLVGTQRLLYGSDSCWTPDPLVLRQVAAIDGAAQPDGTTWRALTATNARRLLGGQGPSA